MLCILTSVTFLGNYSVTAAEDSVGNRTLLDVVHEQTDEQLYTELAELMQENDVLPEYSLEGKAILRIYYLLGWTCFTQELDARTAEAVRTYYGVDYLIFDQSIICLRNYDNAETGRKYFKVRTEYTEDAPRYIEDIVRGNAILNIGGEEYNVTKITCFDRSEVFEGTIVFYETDNGTFVRYYEWEYADAVEFPLKEFQDYAIRYDAYCSFLPAYDEKGNLLSDGSGSFLNFVKKGAPTPMPHSPGSPY